MFFRFILVNIFSFIKRFFAYNAMLYNVIIFIPLFTVITTRISKKSLIFIFIFSLIFLLTGNIEIYVHYGMYFLLLLAIPMFRKVNFEKLLSRSFIFFLIVSFYGIFQKYFGYSLVETKWMRSGLSIIQEGPLFITDDIRPFSTFASIPEFTLFISVFLYFFTIKHKYSLIIFSFIMLYVAGSRGLIISTLIAYFFTFIFKKYNNKYLLFSFFASLFVYLFLIFIFPYTFNQSFDSRMFVYGTFNGRIELLKNVLEKSSLLSLITGLDVTDLNIGITFDNLYLMLITNFGILGGIYFLFFFIRQNIDKKKFYFLSIFLGYGFYADMVFSYYLMFLFFFAIYSNNNVIIEPKVGTIIFRKNYLST